MIPYFLLIIIPAIMCFVAKKNNKLIISGNSDIVRNNNLALPCFFILLFLLLAFRDNTIGRDLSNYQVMFNYYLRSDWKTIITDYKSIDGQLLFRIISKTICLFTNDFNVYKAVIALMTVIPMGVVYSRDRNNAFLKMILFVNMSTFVLLFSGLRQSFAIAIGVSLCYRYTKEKRLLAFLLSCVVAILLHHSSFMLLLLFPAYHLKLSKRKAFLLLPVIVLVIMFNRRIFTLMSVVLSDFSSKYAGEITSTGAYGSFFLFAVFSIISFVIPDEAKLDSETYGLRNILLLSVVLQSFAALNPLAMRLNYYFIIFTPITMSRILERRYTSNKYLSTYSRYGIEFFFLVLYFMNVYQQSIAGISALDTFPYVSIWG